MAMAKIKKGDTVIVRSGAYKGTKGKVLEVFQEASRVLVEGVNMKKKHVKNPGDKHAGGSIVDISHPIHISNVGILDSKSGKATRVGMSVEKDKKVRIAKKSGVRID